MPQSLAQLPTVTTYRRLFAIGQFRVLFLARACSMVGVVVGSLALGTVMYDATDSPVLTALAMFGGPMVQLITSNFLLAASDLLRPRTALVVTGSVAAIVDALQLLPGLPWPARFGLVACVYVVSAATSGTAIALISDIVPTEAFVLGRATMNITVGGIQVIGNGIGALLLLVVAPVHLFAISAVALLAAVVVARIGLADHPPRARGPVAKRTRTVNRQLLRSPVIRPVLLMNWIPNGLIVGCEALYIPYAHGRAGYLFAATAAGMLTGDIVMGRFVTERFRQRTVVHLRLLLAAPFLLLAFRPPVPIAALLGVVAAFGYTGSLALQERLIQGVATDIKGQTFGLAGAGLAVGQAVGALLAGTVGQLIGPANGMTAMAVLSIAATCAIAPGLRRSNPQVRRSPTR
ncbi:MFS transporter [Flexivirga meconopsidis]|uniref:MFS transporter n=1 Tax=Flexivirga meconopsidis TaxID=2977121 RepID=UPI0022404ECA|nr:MFS transporter [Flexivirga meconopsidis]